MNPQYFDNQQRVSSLPIYIGNLPHNFHEDEIKSLCSRYGIIRFFKIVWDNKNPHAEVFYMFDNDANEAIKNLHYSEFNGKNIRVTRKINLKALDKQKECYVQIENIDPSVTEKQLFDHICKEAIAVIVKIHPPRKNKPTHGYIACYNKDDALRVLTNLNNTEIGGLRIELKSDYLSADKI